MLKWTVAPRRSVDGVGGKRRRRESLDKENAARSPRLATPGIALRDLSNIARKHKKQCLDDHFLDSPCTPVRAATFDMESRSAARVSPDKKANALPLLEGRLGRVPQYENAPRRPLELKCEACRTRSAQAGSPEVRKAAKIEEIRRENSPKCEICNDSTLRAKTKNIRRLSAKPIDLQLKCDKCKSQSPNDHEPPGAARQTDPSRVRNAYATTLPNSHLIYTPLMNRNARSLAALVEGVKDKSLFSPSQSSSALHDLRKATVLGESSPVKRPKIDHVNDFLQQISCITSPEDVRIQSSESIERWKLAEVSVSPLLRRFVDLRFSKIDLTKVGESPVDDKRDSTHSNVRDEAVYNILGNDSSQVDEQCDKGKNSVDALEDIDLKPTAEPSGVVEIKRNKDTRDLNSSGLHVSKVIKPDTPRKQVKVEVARVTMPIISELPHTSKQFEEPPIRRNLFETALDESTVKDESSDFHDMSLDEIIDAILDTTCSDRIPKRADHDSQLENEANEVCEDNLTNDRKEDKTKTVSETKIERVNSCGDSMMHCCFRDRCRSISLANVAPRKDIGRKRSSSSLKEFDDFKRRHVESSLGEFDNSFALKRQRCIRRRRTNPYFKDFNKRLSSIRFPNRNEAAFSTPPKSGQPEFGSKNSFEINQNEIQSREINQNVFNARSDLALNDASFSSSCPSAKGCPKDDQLDHLSTSGQYYTFSPWKLYSHLSPRSVSPGGESIAKAASSTPTSAREITGSVELQVRCRNGNLMVHVVRCKDLSRSGNRPINAYVKVSLVTEPGSVRGRRPAPQRTAVQANNRNPHFDYKFIFRLGRPDLQNVARRLQLEVWHRDRTHRCANTDLHSLCNTCRQERRSEFLGCTSFDVQNAVKKDVDGVFTLVSQPSSTGADRVRPTMDDREKDREREQREADEHLFLRYLELDPTEGPEAPAAALQRRASGNVGGRTPFTSTRRLARTNGASGFGFSVLWTHPPRVERVEKAAPAEKAGLQPGDYIVFVDKHNVVTMPEIDVLNLIRSYGNTLTLEIFRRNGQRDGAATDFSGSVETCSGPAACVAAKKLPLPPPLQDAAKPQAQADGRRRLHLPQVTFSSEKPRMTEDESRNRAMYQLVTKEQQYATALQFAVTRFVAALAERHDLIDAHDHHVLFQNSEELLHITEDIIEAIIHEDGEPQLHLLASAYESKLVDLTTAYRRYCTGLKRADLLLATKTKNCESEFSRFLRTPAIPRRRPDITAFLHRPLEHYRDVLKLLGTVLSETRPSHPEYPMIGHVVREMRATYREMTAAAGLMEPVGEGRPLLSVQDLENRLVFTKCKPFVLSKPGRQWIFGGDLARVDGRTVHTYWALLFSDLLLFAKVSRDRVLFVTEEPLALANVTELYFDVRKKATEFRLTVEPGGVKKAQSPTAHCGPDLSRTPRKNANKKCVVLRAPTLELKAVWQNLLRRQLWHVNSGVEGAGSGSPADSPDVVPSLSTTLHSAESLPQRRHQAHRCPNSIPSAAQRQIDELIEHKCKQLSKTGTAKGGAIHLEQWMKGQLGRPGSPDNEPQPEIWTEEELRKRSEELQLVDTNTHVVVDDDTSRIEEIVLSDHEQSPSRSTTTESQVTVRSSPLVPEQISVCKQCHETCLSNATTPNLNIHHTNNNVIHTKCSGNVNVPQNFNGKVMSNNVDIGTDDEWGSLMLMGLAAINPTTSFIKVQDPFSPKSVPKISVVPPTPDQTSINCSPLKFNYANDNINSPPRRKIMPNLDLIKDYEESPDDSPQNEHPYEALGNCNQVLRRYGTLSSLEKLTEENSETLKNTSSDSEEEDESTKTDPGQTAFTSFRNWTAKAGNFVSERMAFFERFTEEPKDNNIGFFNRYLTQSEIKKEDEGNGAYEEDCETSNATSGEEIWGTPTSGGELEDPLTFPNSDGGNVSPQSMGSTNGDDDTELMMDELLMAPPVISSAVRGLLPRRRLEPLMEEEDSDTYTTSSSSTSLSEKVTPSPEEGNGSGGVADECSAAADCPTSGASSSGRALARSPSYRQIVEQAEEAALSGTRLPQVLLAVHTTAHLRAGSTRAKATKIFDFFNARRNERRVHECFAGNKPILRVFSKDNSVSDPIPAVYPQKPLSPMLNKDRQLDRRFWKQLSKRRRSGNRAQQVSA